jgi:hypothetical protein
MWILLSFPPAPKIEVGLQHKQTHMHKRGPCGKLPKYFLSFIQKTTTRNNMFTAPELEGCR